MDPIATSNVAESTPAPSTQAPWSDARLQDLFVEVVPELVDIVRLAAMAAGEPEIAARLEDRLPGPYGQDFIHALIGVVQRMFPLQREDLGQALQRAGAEAAADARRFS
jgi:hypothetical protein